MMTFVHTTVALRQYNKLYLLDNKKIKWVNLYPSLKNQQR